MSDTAKSADGLADLGYKQELKRELGPFASFASGFSFVSILTTVFELFGFGFGLGGPAFFWTWPLVFIGQFSVALVFAELSVRFPVAGAIYQWSRRVSTDPMGWFAGWFMLIGYIVSVSAIAIAMQLALPGVWAGFQIVGGDPSPTSVTGGENAIVLGTIVILICGFISAFGIKRLATLTVIGVSTEIFGVALLIIILFTHTVRGPGVVFSTGGVEGKDSYVWAFLASMLMATYVMYGFDSAAELSEETRDPRRTAPSAITRCMLVSAIGGGLVLLGALMASPSLTDGNLANNGIAYVLTAQAGNVLGRIMLAIVAVSIFSAALAITASARRPAAILQGALESLQAHQYAADAQLRGLRHRHLRAATQPRLVLGVRRYRQRRGGHRLSRLPAGHRAAAHPAAPETPDLFQILLAGIFHARQMGPAHQHRRGGVRLLPDDRRRLAPRGNL